MYTFFESRLDKILPIKENLKENNKFHEYEFRFNEIGGQKNLTKENFLKIYNHFKKSNITMQNEIIIDYIYNPKTIENFFTDNNKDKKKKFMKKVTYKNQYQDYDEDFNFLDFNPSINKTYKQPVEYMLKHKQKQYTKDHIRLSYNIETNLNNYIAQNEDNMIMIHSSNKPYKLIRFKNRYTYQLDEYYKVDLTIVKSLTPSQYKQKSQTDI